jgi:hypothetical protein
VVASWHSILCRIVDLKPYGYGIINSAVFNITEWYFTLSTERGGEDLDSDLRLEALDLEIESTKGHPPWLNNNTAWEMKIFDFSKSKRTFCLILSNYDFDSKSRIVYLTDIDRNNRHVHDRNTQSPMSLSISI